MRALTNDKYLYVLIETHGARKNYTQLDLEIQAGARRFVVSFKPGQKIAMPKTFDFSFADAKKLEAELGATTETKLIGAEVLDGAPTTVYQYTTTIKTPTPTTVTAKVWIGGVDGLPRKMESTTKAGVKTVTTYYDYGANIVIEPPIK